MSEYDTDLVLWSREQADLLRRMAAGERVNDQVDIGPALPRRSNPWAEAIGANCAGVRR